MDSIGDEVNDSSNNSACAGPMTSVDNSDIGAIVWGAISHLEPRSRELLLLVRFQRRSVEFAAKSMGIPVADARRLLAHALREVTARIDVPSRQPPNSSRAP